MTMSKSFFGAAIAALLFGAATLPANAAPGGSPALATATEHNGTVEAIHWRSSRHGHLRNGNRWWHGGHANRWNRGYYSRDYGYNRGPSFSLRFGGGDWDNRRNRRYYD